jgi:alkylation response protein AidB-like acyl-CoA dehydrogenase
MQLYLQAIMVGCLSAGLSDARNLLRSRRRTFDNAPSQQPTRDPLLLAELGKAAAAAFAARSTVMAAARDIDRAYASYFNGDASPSMFARASESAALAKVHVDELALTTATSLFDVGGASGASRERNLDRHWRSIRTLTLHNPAAYKALALGDLFVNDTPLPANGYF